MAQTPTPLRPAETELQITISQRATTATKTTTDIAAPKRDLSANTDKKGNFEALLRKKLTRKSSTPKRKNLQPKHHRNLDAATPIQVGKDLRFSYKKIFVSSMQPQHRGTLTHPCPCDLQRLSCKAQKRSFSNNMLKVTNSYHGSLRVFTPDYLRCDPVQLNARFQGRFECRG